MSLYLRIKQVTNIKIEGQSKVFYQAKKIDTKMTLVIQNSKGGALLVSKIKFNRLQWEEPYKFLTAIDQNVEFVLVKGDQKQAQSRQNILGRGKLYTKKFFKMFQHRILQQQKQNRPFQYEITLFKQIKHEQVTTGVVKLEVQIDSSKHFQGQVISNANLDLRGQLHTNPRFVKIYLGKSSKVNFFSLCDEKVNDQKFRFIQSIYKDLQ